MNFKVLYGLYFSIVTIMLFAIGVTLVKVCSGFMAGFRLGYENVVAVSTTDSLSSLAETRPLPLLWAGAGIHVKSKEDELGTVLSEDPNIEKISITPSVCMVVLNGKVENGPKIMLLSLMQTLLAFCVLGVSVAMLVFLIKLFIRLRIALNAKEIFNMRVVNTMRVLGILLLVQVFVGMLFSYLQGTIAGLVLSRYDIEILRFEDVDYPQIIFGLAIIMISEVFKIGYKIQEEQNLTV